MSKGWTEERRKKQAEAIKRTKPWEKATGPKSREGKAKSAMNALKHGAYTGEGKEMRIALRHQAAFLRHIRNSLIAHAAELCKTNELIKDREKSDG